MTIEMYIAEQCTDINGVLSMYLVNVTYTYPSALRFFCITKWLFLEVSGDGNSLCSDSHSGNDVGDDKERQAIELDVASLPHVAEHTDGNSAHLVVRNRVELHPGSRSNILDTSSLSKHSNINLEYSRHS